MLKKVKITTNILITENELGKKITILGVRLKLKKGNKSQKFKFKFLSHRESRKKDMTNLFLP